MGIEKYIGKYLSMLVKSYNPDQYAKLLDEHGKTYIKFTIQTIGLVMVLFLISFSFVSLKTIRAIPDTLEGIDKFEISGKIEANHPVQLFEEPSIVVDLNETGERSDEDLLLTNSGFSYKKYIFFGSTFVPWEEVTDFKQQTEARDTILSVIMMFLLPSIFFWYLVVSLLKLFIVFIFLVIIGYYVPKLLKHRMLFKETVKLAILAMPSVMIIGVGFFPLAPSLLFWWGLLLTVIVYTIGIFLMSERKVRKV